MSARIARHTALLVAVAFFIIPTYYIVLSSFKTKTDILGDPLGIPWANLTLANYTNVFTQAQFSIVSAIQLSAAFAFLTAVGVVIFGSALSYVVARMRAPWGDRLFLFLFLGLIVPPQVVVIPVVKVLAAVGLLHTFYGLVLYEIGLDIPFATFVYAGFIRTVPRELDEAAEIDGAGRIQTFVRVIFPLIIPATASLFTIIFIWTWNDFINPLTVLGSSGGFTVTTGVYRSLGIYQQNWGAIFANIVVATGPMVVMYMFMQRFIVGGLTGGAVKG